MSPRLFAARLSLALFVVWWTVTVLWWHLAFADLAAAPSWLLRAQDVCFGSTRSGLPEPYGWVALVVGPLGMFAGLVVIFRTDLTAAVSLLRTSLVGTLSIVICLAVSAAYGAYVVRRIDRGLQLAAAEKELPTLLSEMPEGWPRGTNAAPELGLVDHRGDAVTIASLRGKVVILTFAFAHCQTICPTLVKRVQGATGELPDDVELLIITLDPWRDTPTALPGIAAGWRLGARQRVLSGAVDDVNRVLDAYNVPRDRDMKTGEVAHPALVAVIDGQGRLAYLLNGPSTEWIADAVVRARS